MVSWDKKAESSRADSEVLRNIVTIDYGPGASEVNQLNRIKLMISIAKSNFEEGRLEEEGKAAEGAAGAAGARTAKAAESLRHP